MCLKSIGMFNAYPYLRLEASREVSMPYELENRLVIGVASSAVFDLLASDAVFPRTSRLNWPPRRLTTRALRLRYR